MKELRSIFRIRKFAGDPAKYGMLQKFWAGLLKDQTGLEPEPYVENVYANGTDMMDGNPILSTIFKDQKALRIIQLEKDPEEPILAAWIDEIDIENKTLKELVISLQLRPDTYTEVRNMIKLYFTGALTESILEGINEKYDANWNLDKLGHAVHRTDYDQVFHQLRNLYAHELQTGDIDLQLFKRFQQYYVSMQRHGIIFSKSSPLKKTYVSFIKNIDSIHDLISIHQTVDLSRVRSQQRYLKSLTAHWTPKQYIFKLHSYSQRAEEEYDFLKELVPETED